MNYIDYQKQQFAIDTLIKLADSSPVKKNYSNSIYGREKNSYDISQQELVIWVNYINSVLDILSGYINPIEISLIKGRIRNITYQTELTCTMRALNIERELLNMAQSVLRNYR